jgi:hypothetical protein
VNPSTHLLNHYVLSRVRHFLPQKQKSPFRAILTIWD